MPSRTGVARRIAGSAINSCSGHIWISEDLLERTYKSFAARLTSQPKRHGSHVPGPLEASRRLAKRRYNDMSIGTCGIVSHLDPILNLGWLGKLWTRSVEQDWTWEPPCLQAEEIGRKKSMSGRKSLHAEFSNYDITISFPDIPSWFNARSRRSPLTLEIAPQNSQTIPLADVEPPSIPSEVTNIENFKAGLAEVYNLEELRKLYFLFRQANIDTALCSSLAFSHLLARYHALRHAEHHQASALRSSLFEFLQDPVLDLSCGINFRYMVDFLECETVSIEECNTLIELLPTQLLQCQAIYHIMNTIMQKLVGITYKVYHSDPLGALIDSYKKIWLALGHVRGSISTSEDAAVTRTLLCQVLELPVRKQTKRFVKLILRYDSEQFYIFHTKSNNPERIVEQTWRHNEEWCLLLARTSRFLFLYDSRNSRRKGTLLSNRTNNFLASLKHSSYVEAWAICTAGQIIQNILDKTSDRSVELDFLRHWLGAVGKSKYVWSMEYTGKIWAALFDIVATAFSPAEVLLHLPAPPWYSMQTLVLRHWVKRSLDIHSVTDDGQNSHLPSVGQENVLLDADVASEAVRTANGYHQTDVDNSTAMVVQPQEWPQALNNISQYRRRTEYLHSLKHAVGVYVDKVEKRYAFLIDEQKSSYIAGCHNIRGVAKYDLYMLQALEHVKKHSYDLAAGFFLEMALARGSWRAFNLTAHGIKHGLHLQMTLRHRRLLEQYIRKYSKQRPATALGIYHLDRRLPLSRVPRLPLDLISASTGVNIRHTLSLLWHSDPGAFVPPADRVYHPNCPLTAERILLVHEAALRIALSGRYTCSAAWQAVIRCYYFLHTHSAPLGPMLSRAIIIAGLVKPMQAWKHIGLERIRFVVRIICEIDGEEAADKVDRAMLAYHKKYLYRSTTNNDRG